MTRADSERLARVETKLDVALGRMDDHETRIRSGERWRWYSQGVAAVVASAVTIFVKQHT